MVAQITSVEPQRRFYLSSAKYTVESLMTQCFHDVHRCERMVEAENDRLYRQLAGISRIVECHKVGGCSSACCRAMELVHAALTSEENGRDLEAFGKRYTTRNALQIELQAAVETMMSDFGRITESVERHANAQLQAMIDVSSAIERELEEDIERLKDQLKIEKHQTSKLKAEIQALTSSYEADQTATQREIERSQQLLQCERSQKHEMELDANAFREKYETQQWLTYQGAAELAYLQAELNAVRLNQVFLEIENDQLQQHIRALNATLEFEVDNHSSGDLESAPNRDWTYGNLPRIEAMPPRNFEILAQTIVCADNIGVDQLDSYFESEFQLPEYTTPRCSWLEALDAKIDGRTSSADDSESDGWLSSEFVVCIDDICTEVSSTAYF